MKERELHAISGWPMLAAGIVLLGCGIWSLIHAANAARADAATFVILGVVLEISSTLILLGLFSVQPNEARVLILFGRYVGTVRDEGFRWANPFSVKRASVVAAQDPKSSSKQVVLVARKNKYRVSLRVRNFQTNVLKVNDQRGNPIEIAAVVVWRIVDTAEALFDVDDYDHYVEIQSESAVRHAAMSYPYDLTEGAEETTLRGGSDKVTVGLQRELQGRLDKAGVEVLETRLTHLAYAPEIAAVMLRRQQAEAIIAARTKIVHAAVTMIEMALNDLSARKVVELDDERKAAMVGNLLVVLCGESETHPIVNVGTLYH